MRRAAWVLVFAIATYLLCAVLGYVGVLLLSGNQHDLELEAAMTAIFVWGPLGALLGAGLGWVRSRPARPRPPSA
jgi:hypothetical protein